MRPSSRFLIFGLAVSLLSLLPEIGTSETDAQTWTTQTTTQELTLKRTASGYALDMHGTERAIPLAEKAKPHALIGTSERFWLTAVDAGQMVLLAGDGLGTRAIPTPEVHAPVLVSPTPLVEDRAALRGLVWLAGETEQSLAVYAAMRNENGTWDAAATIAPPGPGSQLALTAARLPDGWLAVWTTFDGQDDEVVWSRFDGTVWSQPAPIVAEGNDVPDITPQLRHTPEGAVVAWSRFVRGDKARHGYYTAVARFRQGSWTAPQLISGPGSLYPSFSAMAGHPLIISRQVVPSGWQIVELDDTGAVSRRSTFETSDRQRPRIAERTNTALTLQWNDGEEIRNVQQPWTAVR